MSNNILDKFFDQNNFSYTDEILIETTENKPLNDFDHNVAILTRILEEMPFSSKPIQKIGTKRTRETPPKDKPFIKKVKTLQIDFTPIETVEKKEEEEEFSSYHGMSPAHYFFIANGGDPDKIGY